MDLNEILKIYNEKPFNPDYVEEGQIWRTYAFLLSLRKIKYGNPIPVIKVCRRVPKYKKGFCLLCGILLKDKEDKRIQSETYHEILSCYDCQKAFESAMETWIQESTNI